MRRKKLTYDFKNISHILAMLFSSAASAFYFLTSLMNTRLLFAVLLVGFAFVGGGVWHYLPWSKSPVAHAFSLGIGIGLFSALIVFFMP